MQVVAAPDDRAVLTTPARSMGANAFVGLTLHLDPACASHLALLPHPMLEVHSRADPHSGQASRQPPAGHGARLPSTPAPSREEHPAWELLETACHRAAPGAAPLDLPSSHVWLRSVCLSPAGLNDASPSSWLARSCEPQHRGVFFETSFLL